MKITVMRAELSSNVRWLGSRDAQKSGPAGFRSAARRGFAARNATLVIAIALLLIASTARAADDWTLTSADFSQRTITPASIDASGISDGNQVIPWSNIISFDRVNRTVSHAGKFTLSLLSGDALTGQAAAGGDSEHVVWHNALLGDVKLDLGQIKSITRDGSDAPAAAGDQDAVYLANGDSMKGIVAAIDDGNVSLQVQNANQATPIPWDSVSAVVLANPPPKARAGGQRLLRLSLADGAKISAASLGLTAGDLTLILQDQSAHALPLDQVLGIEQINGPVSWLCNRTPSHAEQIPAFGDDPSMPARMGATVDGKSIVIGDRTYPHGIGVHSLSRLSWPLDGQYAALRIGYGIAGDLPLADVTVRVLLDNTAVFERKHVRGGQVYPIAIIPLGEAKTLTLEVDYGDNSDIQDRLNWLDPALLRNLPAAPSTQSAPSTQPAAQCSQPVVDMGR